MYYSIKRPRPLCLPGLQLVLLKLINLYSELMTKTTDHIVVLKPAGSAFGVSLSIAPSIRRDFQKKKGMDCLLKVSSSYVSVLPFSLLTNNGHRPKFIVECSLAPFSMFKKAPPSPSPFVFIMLSNPPPPPPHPPPRSAYPYCKSQGN